VSAAVSLLDQLQARGAWLDGHFALSSGRHSDRFVQKFRILEDPQLLEPLARDIAAHFAALRPTVVLSAAVGGIILGYEVARALELKAIFVEKEAGVPVLRRNFDLTPADRVLVVEDVVTTGGSVREVLNVIRAHGAQAVGVGTIVRRAAVTFEVETFALLDLPIESYAPADCPLCAHHVPLSDPGSRRSS